MMLVLLCLLGILSGSCIVLIFAQIRAVDQYETLMNRYIKDLELFEKTYEMIQLYSPPIMDPKLKYPDGQEYKSIEETVGLSP